MMYRTVDTGMWQDPWFVDLKPDAKCLFLFLFTNPRVTACGAMEISLSQIAFETKIAPKKVEQELRAFGDKVAWWPELNLLVVRNFYKRQRANSSENFAKAARKAMERLPEVAKEWLWEVYPELKEGMVSPKDTHPQPIPHPSPTHGDKETVTVTVTASETGETPLPPKGEPPKPFDLLVAMCEVIGTNPNAMTERDKARELAVAKRLIANAATIDEIREITRYLRGQPWVTAGVDLSLIDKQIAKWRMNGRPNAASNGRSLRSITADHAGEDRAYLERGLPPVWGSANGGIDKL